MGHQILKVEIAYKKIPNHFSKEIYFNSIQIYFNKSKNKINKKKNNCSKSCYLLNDEIYINLQ